LLEGDGGIVDMDTKDVADETPVTIGVSDTSAGFSKKDYNRMILEMAMAGKQATTIIANGETILEMMSWDLFTKEVHEKTRGKLELTVPIPTLLKAVPNANVGDKIIILSKEFALIKYIKQHLMVETAKIITKKVEEAAISIDVGVAVGLRNGRMVADPAQTYNKNQIPKWFYR
ncbi:MAG: hypothetical protein GY765_05380, partial [bacterium]|nr:hypothetical protein [bacterium]